MNPIRVLLVDDHQMLREGLRAILARSADIEVVGEASNGFEALDLARRLGPDIVVMDVAMPELNGVEATRDLVRTMPGIRVVALSTYSDKRYVLSMLAAGAAGYVLKQAAHQELLSAIQATRRGEKYLSPSVAGVVVDGCLHPAEPQDSTLGAALGPRERAVLQLLAEGLTSRQIAQKLSIAPSTVETHRRNISSKLRLHSVAELTKYAVREGLTSLDA